MLIKKNPAWQLPESAVTPEAVFLNRRRFMQGTIAGAAALAMPISFAKAAELPPSGNLVFSKNARLSTDEKETPFEDVTSYNNFYEFGTDKTDPAKYAGSLPTRPWSIAVEGECDKPGTLGLEDLVKPYALEERIYRHRCVEAWSMVIPWVGFPLSDLLKRFEPNSRAKYVAFETLYDPKHMPGQSSLFSQIPWPYREGLRMDEAMNQLTLVTVGLYGKVLPNQNGAPLRLVVPWKYGFKSIKSIVKIRFQEKQPETTWNTIASNEYGFYSNVNPHVDHPRWSQKRERRLPSGLFSPHWIPTRMFNGYGEYVAGMYKGMDLRKYF